MISPVLQHLQLEDDSDHMRLKRQSPPPEGLELPPISSDGPHPLISGDKA